MNLSTLFMPYSKSTILIFFFLLFSSCSKEDSFGDLAKDHTEWRGDREYVAIWSQEGIPLLEVRLEYHGKQPDLPFVGEQPSYDWTTRNTDFYSIMIRNLTNQPIELSGVLVEMEKSRLQEASRYGSSYLAKRWGTTLIQPQATIKRRNTWVWGKGDKNTLTKTYLAKILPGESAPSSELNDLIQSKGQLPLAFSFKASLKFIR